eukprot:CAMPEP_0172592340 /NCGR_PEP_ID=MMETSP1068-20121228/11296_1 /TAXON_ID=35684 /ORGANISM="Pseudopedinella elastica, Strain CCMP716" /LENGTH=233 /DNA_ID=CAMNT_0013389291 /DNA_START=252 /DNA_END=953 /DNA_ORIENTATION=+
MASFQAACSLSSAPSVLRVLARTVDSTKVRLVLASQSPRRREIFDLMGLEGRYEVIVSSFEETLDKGLYRDENGPARYAMDNAVEKAREVATRLASESPDARSTIVVGSDTIVDLDGNILEKPKSEAEAKAMLRSMSGRGHWVHSGVGMFKGSSEKPIVAFTESTRVRFASLSDAEIDAYVASGEPMDKAGSYGIQGLGGQLVEGIEGCYFSVMGLPMRRVSTSLCEILEGGA